MFKKFIIVSTETWVVSNNIEVEVESDNIEELQEKILEGDYTIIKKDFTECLDFVDHVILNEENQELFEFEELLEE